MRVRRPRQVSRAMEGNIRAKEMASSAWAATTDIGKQRHASTSTDMNHNMAHKLSADSCGIFELPTDAVTNVPRPKPLLQSVAGMATHFLAYMNAFCDKSVYQPPS